MEIQNNLERWLNDAPKAELHLHIDGSLQAHRMLQLAEKNKIHLPYSSTDEILAAYDFNDLQSFLDLYYLGASVLRDEEDFYHLMMDYLKKCRQQNIVHTEIMVEPQTYAPYGVSFETMMSGFNQAIGEASQQWEQSVLLILSVLRHLTEDEAMHTLEQAEPFRQHFTAVGLASAEVGNPPEKFQRFYQVAQQKGYKAVAHAGEEGPAQYVWDALNKLNVQRIDHGVRCIEDDALMQYLREHAVPLTVCPLSNVRLRVFKSMQEHTILKLLEAGLMVTVNSDDPTYFGGFLTENYIALARDLNLNETQARTLINNSFNASFLSSQEKSRWTAQLADLKLDDNKL